MQLFLGDLGHGNEYLREDKVLDSLRLTWIWQGFE